MFNKQPIQKLEYVSCDINNPVILLIRCKRCKHAMGSPHSILLTPPIDRQIEIFCTCLISRTL